MKILHLPVHISGVAYYRHHLPLVALRAAGHTVISPNNALGNWTHDCAAEVTYFGMDYEQYLDRVLSEGVDVIHTGWSNSLEYIELLVAAREKYKVPVLIDYDDDVLSVDEYNVSYKYYHEGSFSRRVVRLGMRVMDAVTVSTAPLADSLKRESRAVHVLPNYTNPPDWLDLPLDSHRQDDHSVRVLFAGGPSHLGDLTQVKEAVEWAVGHYDGKGGRPHVKFIFLCCMPDWAAKWIKDDKIATRNRVFYVPGTDEDIKAWHSIVKWLAPDVMMAPLLHNKFNSSKSLIKAYDAAMVEGCAFVCEDWPAYDDVPPEAALKVTGGGWQEALKATIESADLRHNLSRRLRQWTLDSRTITAHINEWERVYETALARPIVSDLSDIVRPRILGPDGRPVDD